MVFDMGCVAIELVNIVIHIILVDLKAFKTNGKRIHGHQQRNSNLEGAA